jgi:hypothetical protein
LFDYEIEVSVKYSELNQHFLVSTQLLGPSALPDAE